jgi:peptidyl-tRNA hydrolase
VLSRADLPPGLQAAQAAHSAFQFSLEHPDVMRAWHEGSNCLVLLSVPDEQALLVWRDAAESAGLAVTLVIEPDLGDEHTALAVGPTRSGMFSALPLTGREVAMA